jgi:mono/diheme cytochrome c family protein
MPRAAALVFLNASIMLGATITVAAGRGSPAYHYTATQAAQGKAIYDQRCAVCHGSAMDGMDEAPPLVGARFDSRWRNQPAELYSKVKLSMPQDDPGILTVAQAQDVVAAILQANKMPGRSRAAVHRL